MVYMLKGPEDFPRFREDIQAITSMESVGERKIEFPTGFFKKDEKCLEVKGMFFPWVALAHAEK